MDMKIEVVQIPVANIDRARDFYNERLAFTVDLDLVVPGGMRVVQLTPPGSACSIQLVQGEPDPHRTLTLVVPDVVLLHKELTARGAPLTPVIHYENGIQLPGPSDEPWSTMTSFSDPDGNPWTIQQRPPS